MPPASKKLEGQIASGRLSFRPFARPLGFLIHFITLKTVYARVLKFHIWMPHEILADSYFLLVWIMPLS